MKDSVLHEIKFQITRQENGDLDAYFEQDNLKYSRLEIIELEEFEYFVADSPISDTISGHISFHLLKNTEIRSECSYEIKIHTNLVRNQASSDVYQYADKLLDRINLAISNSIPVQVEIQNELEETTWYLTCS